MSKFLGAMDNYTPASSNGENGHKQYKWADLDSTVKPKGMSLGAIEEAIVQISFQLVRTKCPNPEVIRKYQTLLKNLKNDTEHDSQMNAYYIGLLVKLCAHTRDIVSGKGEYSLAFSMLRVLYDLFPKIASVVMRNFVLLEVDGISVHPYGSWKDIKYMNCGIENIKLVNEQLRKDEDNMAAGKNVSLAGKWVPREGSKYGHHYQAFACDYFNHFLLNSKEETRGKAIKLCNMYYRKLLTALNRYLDTTQVKQCEGNWKNIVPEKVTSVTLFRNKKAFLNVDKKGSTRRHDIDRVECAANFNKFLDKAKEGKVEVKGKRIGLNDFTKEALELIPKKRTSAREVDMINLQWKSNSSQNGPLENFVPLVDVSGSMDGDPLYAAIALGIRIAEKSKLGKRVLTFTSNPKWVNLEGKTNFVDMVEEVKKSEWGMETNFYKALKLILDVIKQQKMTAQEVNEISLIILSDMMINQADKTFDSMYDMIEKEYADTGRSICGEPYTPPHIVFWNLRSTNGFPSLSKQKNTSMLSGFSPVLLNLFCEKGVACLEDFTPWSMLKDSLNNPRYNVLDEILNSL